jgi:hypothetical protein
LLPDHHRAIEQACAALRARALSEDPRALLAQYRALEREVLVHLQAEEVAIVPAYAEHAPDDAARIRAEHGAIRELLYRIAIEVELHAIRLHRLDKLIATLQTHAAHEDRMMYPWAQRYLPLSTKRELFVRIGRSLEHFARIAVWPLVPD